MSDLANLYPYKGPTPSPGLSIALVVGNVISFCLYGALTVQLYIYHISFPNDSKTRKGTVYAIYLIETIYTASLAYDLTYLVLDDLHHSIGIVSLIVPICGGLVALLTQAVYAHRIRIITQMKFIPLCFVALIAIELVITAVLIPLQISFFLIALIWASCSLLADLTFAIVMIQILMKEKIYSKQLRRRIVRLLHLVVGCGLLTGINIATLAASLCSFNVTICCGIVLSKIYANSMMVLVNDRQVQSQNDEYSVDSLHVGTIPTTRTTPTAKSQDELSVK